MIYFPRDDREQLLQHVGPLTDIMHNTLIDRNQEAFGNQKRLNKELGRLEEQIKDSLY